MAMGTLQAAIAAVADVAGGLADVRGAPQYPPGKLPGFPWVVTYAGPSRWTGGGNQIKKALHTIIVEFHVAERSVPVAAEAVMPYADSFPKALLDDVQVDSTVDTINEVRSSGFTVLGWDKATLGIRFEIDVKITGT